jgi:hypothetical protein
LADGQWYFIDEAGSANASVVFDTVSVPGYLTIFQSDLSTLNLIVSGELIVAEDITVSNTRFIGWDGRSRAYSPADGKLQLDLETPAAADSVLLDWVTAADTVVISQSDASAITLSVTGSVTASASISTTAGWIGTQTTTGGTLYMTDSTATGDAAGAGNVYFRARDDASNLHTMARIEMDVTAATSGSEEADMVFYYTTPASGASVEAMRLDGSNSSANIPVIVAGTGADPADSGAIRFDNAEGPCWESAPTGTDYCMYLDSAENFYFDRGILSNGSLRIATGSLFYWAGSTELLDGTDGQLTMRQSNDSTGFTLDALTADTLTVKDQAGTGNGHITAAGTITGGTVTDGTLTCTAGTCTGGASITSAVVVAGTAADPADSGAIRFDNNEGLAWESSPAGADNTLVVNASEQLVYSGTISAAGSVVATLSVQAGATQRFDWNGRSRMTSPLDGKWQLDLATPAANNSLLIDVVTTAGSALLRQSDGTAVNIDMGGGSLSTGSIIAISNINSFAAAGGAVYASRNDNTPTPDDVAGIYYFRGYNDTPALLNYAQIEGYIEEEDPADEDGSLLLRVVNDGAMTTVQTIDATDGVEKVSFAWPIDVTGTVEGDTVTDGTLTCTAGTCTGGVSITSTTLTDGSATVTGGDVEAATAGDVRWASSSQMTAPADGDIRLTDSSGGAFNLLQFRGTTATDPAIGPDPTDTDAVAARLADDSAYAGFNASALNIEALYAGKTRMSTSNEGDLVLSNDSYDDFGALIFGGETSAYPSLFRNGSGLAVSNGDTSAYTTLEAGTLQSYGDVIAAASSAIEWTARSQMSSPADGQLLLDLNTPAAANSLRIDVTVADTVTLAQSDGTVTTLDISGGVKVGGEIVKSNIAKPGDADFDTQFDPDVYTIMYTTLTAARTVTLDDDQCEDGREIEVVDAGAGAGTYAITINPEGSSTINGALIRVMNNDNEALTIRCLDDSGANKVWWIM